MAMMVSITQTDTRHGRMIEEEYGTRKKKSKTMKENNEKRKKNNGRNKEKIMKERIQKKIKKE